MNESIGNRKLRLWTVAPHLAPRDVAGYAATLEAQGWDGVMFPDNQSLWGDTVVSMTLAAAATDRLLVGSSATNPGTRHPTVLASALAAVADAARGSRVSLGIARGDSALAHLGAGPVDVARFDAYLSVVRRLLRGHGVPFEDLEPWRPSASAELLPLRDGPQDCRLHWLDPTAPSVPLTVFASGPRTIEAAARHGDQVMFGLGADIDRLNWGIETARTACDATGRDPAGLSFGAGMSVCVVDDPQRGRELVANIVASSARFSSLHGRLAGPATPDQRRVYESIAASYDMNRHGTKGSQVSVLTAEFIDDFAVVGSLAHCVDRLQAIHALGVDDILIGPSRNDADAAESRQLVDAVVNGLIPALRSRAIQADPLEGAAS